MWVKRLPRPAARCAVAMTAAALALLLAACGGGDEAPTIESLGCSPEVVETGQSIACEPSIDMSVDTYHWAAADASTDRGSGSTFATSYGSRGMQTITLQVCSGDGCSDASQTIEVTPPASTQMPRPVVGSLNCLPTQAGVEETVTCDPSINGEVSHYSWLTSDAIPTSGSETTFSTAFRSPGTKRVRLQVCNPGGCILKSQTVLVGGGGEPPDFDEDGVPDGSDNCLSQANPEQGDVDGDGAGDACDSRDNRDPDDDGIENWQDDCPDFPENVNGYLDGDGCREEPEVAVSIDEGEGHIFAGGEVVTFCYTVSGEMFVDIDLVGPSGARFDAFSAFDEGEGGCFDWQPAEEDEPGEYTVLISGPLESEASTSFELA